MDKTPPNPAFPLISSSAVVVGVALFAGALSAAVLITLDQWAHLSAAGATGVLCLIAALAALAPVRLRSTIAPEGAAQGVLIGFGLRLLLSLAAVGALVWVSELNVALIGGWAVGWYLLLLGTEVALLRRYFKRCGRLAAHSQHIQTEAVR